MVVNLQYSRNGILIQKDARCREWSKNGMARNGKMKKVVIFCYSEMLMLITSSKQGFPRCVVPMTNFRFCLLHDGLKEMQQKALGTEHSTISIFVGSAVEQP